MDLGVSDELLYALFVTIAAAVAAGLVYWVARRLAYRFLSGVIDKRLLRLLEFILIILAASLFLAVTAHVYGFPLLVLVALSVLIIGSLTLLVGFRHVIEEYFTGLVLVKAYELKVGDYVEFDNVRGYIVALEDTALVIRDSHRDLVYIPYTRLAHSSFKRFRVEEGHEIRVHVLVPPGLSLLKIREEASRIARSLGVESVKVDVESVRQDGVLLVVRGIIRDPRREDEIRYAILDHIYSTIK
jgi:small-conductance mechanosensitive channel